MSSSLHKTPTTPEFVSFDDTTMHIVLRNGQRIVTPLAQFPRLLSGTSQQRNEWRIIGAGEGIRWPLLDEDISVKSLCVEKHQTRDEAAGIDDILSRIGAIYAETSELCRISGRKFKLDGLFVSTTAQVVAEYIYGLTAHPGDNYLLYASDKRSVKVALTGHEGSRFALRWTEAAKKSHADLLLCLQLQEHGFCEIYNGEFPVELLQQRKGSSTGQIQLSLATLSEVNPALLDREHSFASINRLLTAKVAHAA